jgi:hypothetical protein
MSLLDITALGEVNVGAVAGTAVTGPDDLKANVSALSTFDAANDEVNVGAVKGVAVAGVADFQADVSGISSTLAAIQGAGWTDETLESIKNAIDSIVAGGDATAENQATIIGHLTDIKGATWSTETLVALKALLDALPTAEQIQSGLSTFDPATDEVDIGSVKGTGVTGVGDFHADVSALALETTLEAIQGAGWTDETLVAIKSAVDAIGSGVDATEANQTTIIEHLTDIKGVTWSSETLVALSTLLNALPTLEQMQSGISTFDPALDEVNVGAVKGTAVTGVTDFRADISGLATSAELALLNDLSASDIQSIVDALQTHGDAEWSTADLSGISTLTELQVQTIVDGLNNLSESDVQVLITALQNHGDSAWSTADTSGLSTFNPSTDGVLLSESSQESLVSAVWSATERTITTFGTMVSDIVTAIWGAAERTITGGSVDAVGGQDLSNLDAPVSLVPGAVWDELQAEHSIEGSTAESLASAASGVVDESAIAAAVWSYVDRVITGGTVDIADSLIDALDEIKSTTGGEYDRDLHSLEALRAKLDAITGTGTNTVEAVLSYGEGVAANHISVYVTDLAGNRVAGPKTSDQNGVAEFLIDDGDYLLVVSDSAYLSGGTFPFTVSGSGEHQFALTPITISDPPNGNYCVVYGFAEDLKGDDQTGYAKVVRVHGPEYREVAGEYVDVVYNKEYTTELSDGRWELVVLHGAEVDIKVVYGGGEQKTRRNLTIPSSAQANWRSISEG